MEFSYFWAHLSFKRGSFPERKKPKKQNWLDFYLYSQDLTPTKHMLVYDMNVYNPAFLLTHTFLSPPPQKTKQPTTTPKKPNQGQF